MHPPDFGNSTHMISVPLSEVEPAAQSLRAILAAIQYRGIFSAEFKLDARDGIFKILEINARVWVFVEFAGRCGVDVCTMAYRDALGLPITDFPVYRSGVRLVSPYVDLTSARFAWSQRQLSNTCVASIVVRRAATSLQLDRSGSIAYRTGRNVVQGGASHGAPRLGFGMRTLSVTPCARRNSSSGANSSAAHLTEAWYADAEYLDALAALPAPVFAS